MQATYNIRRFINIERGGNHPKGIALADINGDGKADIVVCNNADNDILVILSK